MADLKPGKDYIGVGCGGLVVDDNDRVLLMKRGPKSKNQIGYWTQPGGTVEYGETIEAAIKREIREELDIDVELTRFLCYTDHIMPNEGQHWVTIAWLAKIASRTPKIMEPEKCDAMRWFDLNHLPTPLSETTVSSTDVLKKEKAAKS